MMNCRHIESLLVRRLYGGLSPRQECAAAAHLEQCSSCRARFAEFQANQKEMQRLAVTQPSSSLAQRALSQWEAERQGRSAFARRPVFLRPAFATFGIAVALLATWGVLRLRHTPNEPSKIVKQDSPSPKTPTPHPNGNGAERKQENNTRGLVNAPPPSSSGLFRSVDRNTPPDALPDGKGVLRPGTTPDVIHLDGRGSPFLTAQPPVPQTEGDVAYRDDFARPPYPQIAGAGPQAVAAAQEAQKREAAIVDTRLFRRVTLAEKGVALEDLCARLAKQTGVALQASRGLRDEKATVFVKNVPARDVLRAIARLFGYYWARAGEEGAYRYELAQALRSRLQEEEMRSRDLNEALMALDAAMQKRVTEEEQHKGVLGNLWGQTQLYARLSAADRAALRNGQRLMFRTDDPNPDRRLPDDLRKPIISAMARYRVDDAGKLHQQNESEGTPVADLPGAKALVSFQIANTDLGQLTLQEAAGHRYPLPSGGESGMGGEQGWGNPMASGRSAATEKPDNARLNKALRGLPAFQRVVSFQPQISCLKLKKEGVPAAHEGPHATWEAYMEVQEAPPSAHVTSADVWEEVHQQTGMSVVADFYTHLYDKSALTMENKSLFDALCRIGETMGVQWRKDGDFLLGRSASFFWDKLKEVPNRSLARWQEDRQRNKALSFDALMEMNALTDAQLDSLTMAQGARHCWGIEEWELVYVGNGGWRNFSLARRAILRFLANASPAVRQRVIEAKGALIRELPASSQQEIMAALKEMGFMPITLLGSRLRVEYVPAGRYVWHPRGGLITSGDAQSALPLIEGKTPEEALTAARQTDPKATEGHIHRTNGVLAITVIKEDGTMWAYGKPLPALR
jgi:hypothetical protein